MSTTIDIFRNGSVWLKMDCHLHTRADKEFVYMGEDNSFVTSYIDRLKATHIGVGVVTNHNKFDLEEFKALKKKSRKEGIYLLPGVELSLSDGANGIHCLITFEFETWIKEGTNYIEQFLITAFEGVANRENENTSCKYSLTDLFKALGQHRKDGRDSFITMAHIEQSSGFCKELNGGRIQTLFQDELFRQNVLAFQKLRTAELKSKLITWLGGKAQMLPALIEGSDCKKLDQIGLCGMQRNSNKEEIEKETWIKIGAHSFEAVKYALIDKQSRVSDKPRAHTNAFVKSIRFEGGLLDKKEFGFSPELNCLIGIRGSGKSSILEILRDTLNITLGSQASDKQYKDTLIQHVLKSGAKVVLEVVDRHGKEYRIEKILGQKPDVYSGAELQHVPSIETVFRTPVYFGQKDLSNKDINFEADLVNRLISTSMYAGGDAIKRKTAEVKALIEQLHKLNDLNETKKEVEDRMHAAQHQLKVYAENGVEEKLKQQSRFDRDIAGLSNALQQLTGFREGLTELLDDYSDFFNKTTFESEENKDLFAEATLVFKQLVSSYETIVATRNRFDADVTKLNRVFDDLKTKKEGLKEEFAKIKREVQAPNLNPDDFLRLNRSIETSKLKLDEIGKQEARHQELKTGLDARINELKTLWHEEFLQIQTAVNRINESESSLTIEIEYRGRKDLFLQKLQDLMRGSGMRSNMMDKIVAQYADFIALFYDKANWHTTLGITSEMCAELTKRIRQNLTDLLTFRVLDLFRIKYNGKALKDHSLGQRATALILFLLAQKDADVLIIDQPEDDLDNQTIYQEVIKEIKALKGNMQFIFATHNANIPVLGDSERVIACAYSEDTIETVLGTIDDKTIQKEIVSIMEGGKEAFDKRKDIYSIWTTDKVS